MAKQNGLPSVDDSSESNQIKRVTEKITNQNGSVERTVEYREEPIAEGYMARRVDVKLPILHRRILRDKLRILQDTGAKLQDGTEVSDKTKAVLWILENEVKV